MDPCACQAIIHDGPFLRPGGFTDRWFLQASGVDTGQDDNEARTGPRRECLERMENEYGV